VAQPFYQQLETHLNRWGLLPGERRLEVKHFFSGAAVYFEGRIVASFSPSGLAFKLGVSRSESLIAAGEAEPLKYFEKGHVKPGYALFTQPDLHVKEKWRCLMLEAMNVSG